MSRILLLRRRRDIRRARSAMRRSGSASSWCSPPIGATCSTIPGATMPSRSASTTRPASVAAIVDAARDAPFDGVLAVGDRPTVIAARVTRGARSARPSAGRRRGRANKRLTRERLQRSRPAGARGSSPAPIDRPTRTQLAASLAYPCVIKPSALSGSRGVMRADDRPSWSRRVRPAARAAAVGRHPCRARSPRTIIVLVEGFIAGHEYAVEGRVEPRRAARARDFRQARSARRPVLRGDDLRDAVDDAGADAERDRRRPVAAARRQALGLHHGPDPRRVPRQRRTACSCSRWPRGRSAACARARCDSIRRGQRRRGAGSARGAAASPCARRDVDRLDARARSRRA